MKNRWSDKRGYLCVLGFYSTAYGQERQKQVLHQLVVIDLKTPNCYVSPLRPVPHKPVSYLKSWGLECVATSQGFHLLLGLPASLLLNNVFLSEDFPIVSINLNVHQCAFCIANDLNNKVLVPLLFELLPWKYFPTLLMQFQWKEHSYLGYLQCLFCLWDSWKTTCIFRLSCAFVATQSSFYFFSYHCNNELVVSTVTIFLIPVILTTWINIAPLKW